MFELIVLLSHEPHGQDFVLLLTKFYIGDIQSNHSSSRDQHADALTMLLPDQRLRHLGSKTGFYGLFNRNTTLRRHMRTRRQAHNHASNQQSMTTAIMPQSTNVFKLSFLYCAAGELQLSANYIYLYFCTHSCSSIYCKDHHCNYSTFWHNANYFFINKWFLLNSHTMIVLISNI